MGIRKRYFPTRDAQAIAGNRIQRLPDGRKVYENPFPRTGIVRLSSSSSPMIVKVCGMRDAENIRQVEQAGADWMGFIDYERSPRYVEGVPEYLPVSLQKVGVFVNASLPHIQERIADWHLDFVQLHGKESPEFCQQLQATGMKVIKAFSLRTPEDVQATEDYIPFCDYFLFDTPCQGYGGSGKSFDWELLTHYQGSVPFLLSGGLNPTSLEALAAFHHPRWAGIDLNSGFEQAPGMKDASSLSTFIHSFKQNKYNF